MKNKKAYWQQSVVLIKPDGVARGLIGEIISRFEKVGLKMTACKLVVIPREIAFKHYGYNDEWFENVGKKVMEFYKEHGKDPNEELGTMKSKEIGKMVQEWNVNYLTYGPVLAMIWEGQHAIEVIRKIVGSTYPNQSAPGTIRGDYAFDSPLISNSEKRSVFNLIHASGKEEEAKLEIELWFKKEEICRY
ncbi:MAG: nucleoside-diphosphate kinase [Candidatus Shapirobacteria bacterium]